ncbi:MAG: glycosyl transferase [Rhodospirillaceae bacterium]|nr:glycosyl transferase [Rhodospirillaceae bacterium]
MVAILVLTWGVLASPESQLQVFTIIAAVILLACVSWVDDLKSLSPGIRLIAQIVAILPAMLWLHGKSPIFQGIVPEYLDLILAGLIWIWFINLFNFMDGIDGISGVEAAAIGAGIAIVAIQAPAAGIDPRLAATIAAGAIGFLCWNWHPAKVFLGDVGSVPLGFLLGWLLLNLASSGAWAAAAILPLYYLADATITLTRRGLRGEKVWHAHREHFYQRAVQNGRSHAVVSIGVALCNVVLIGLAVLSIAAPWLALAIAAATVIVFLGWLSR